MLSSLYHIKKNINIIPSILNMRKTQVAPIQNYVDHGTSFASSSHSFSSRKTNPSSNVTAPSASSPHQPYESSTSSFSTTLAPPGGFTEANTFRATEGWMGNHVFLCNGKIMLGSDAPLFFFTNALIVVALGLHFAIILPHLYQHSPDHWTAHSATFWATLALGVLSLASLWLTGTTDPGILPPVSSPVKPPVPTDGIPIGGPLGYRYCSTCNIFRPPRSKHCNRYVGSQGLSYTLSIHHLYYVHFFLTI